MKAYLTLIVVPAVAPAVVLAAALCLSACGSFSEEISAGPLEHISQSVELDKSEAVRVRLRMGAGKMQVKGGSAHLMDADFTYNGAESKPVVRYESGGARGNLEVSQPNNTGKLGGKQRYEWNLAFNNDKPLNMDLEFGAGEGDLSLGSLNLKNIEVKMGVGELKMDLRGKPKRDYDVIVHGGIGQATVELPKDVGIVADAKGGLGSIRANGLHKRGTRYYNDAYENGAKVNIRLEIQGGIGEIVLKAE